MENHQPFCFASLAPPLMSSISYLNNDCSLDPFIPNYGHDLDELMFSGSGFLDNVFSSAREQVFDAELEATSDIGFNMGCVEVTSNHSLRAEGDTPESGDAAECHKENRGDGNATRAMTPGTMRPMRDRSKTLVSERKRRGRMKEKLYELRSLVPNITKMDKASIIADAIMYVRNLQDEAKKLVQEIAVLELPVREDRGFRVPHETTQGLGERCNPSGRRILRVTSHEVGEGSFYVKVESNKGDGVESSLYVASESLECFHLESSIFCMESERYVLTLTLNVRGLGEEMSESTVKSWVMGALLKEGFNFDTTMIP